MKVHVFREYQDTITQTLSPMFLLII